MDERLPDDAGQVMRAQRQVHAVRKRVLAQVRSARALLERVGAARVRPGRGRGLWRVGRAVFA